MVGADQISASAGISSLEAPLGDGAAVAVGAAGLPAFIL
eukprot:CAMPEP_0172543736 /NCGR_PEP_ID=MMETSP1067-20121228/14039_1 /TAXON_ID=265564 ORGANISM="Thalassiosira punctigera, Strain Tpunct2005C2" /NCGR_SAMPLE_ID=MMETSP1067 /ASSEMBLY_ACC=CAM_ASM_000444 /LENGTH=38 /DNA_ID= /DNA_START= /DNA_END= /DNA_ORIENTATION=